MIGPHKANCDKFRGMLLPFTESFGWPDILNYFRTRMRSAQIEQPQESQGREQRVAEWVVTRIGEAHIQFRERTMRLTEEVFELAQAEGLGDHGLCPRIRGAYLNNGVNKKMSSEDRAFVEATPDCCDVWPLIVSEFGWMVPEGYPDVRLMPYLQSDEYSDKWRVNYCPSFGKDRGGVVRKVPNA